MSRSVLIKLGKNSEIETHSKLEDFCSLFVSVIIKKDRLKGIISVIFLNKVVDSR
jgi:hypothetical protein